MTVSCIGTIFSFFNQFFKYTIMENNEVSPHTENIQRMMNALLGASL
jgi:hypothetical protein